MEQSFENENICNFFLNGIKIENEMLLEPKEMGSFQTERTKHP